MNPNISRLRRQSEFSKQYQATNKAKGLCPCGQRTPRPNRVRCTKCAEQRHTYYVNNTKKVKKRAIKQWVDDKLSVINHYGPICNCCGQKYYNVLVIDHIHGKGTKQRLALNFQGRGSNFYRWLIRNNYPKGLQVLCANCNMAKGTKPKCPCPYRLV